MTLTRYRVPPAPLNLEHPLGLEPSSQGWKPRTAPVWLGMLQRPFCWWQAGPGHQEEALHLIPWKYIRKSNATLLVARKDQIEYCLSILIPREALRPHQSDSVYSVPSEQE